ncbi:hypothetical protein XSR1_110062 [Xenorhabdus szentirmaii DSM 16338]|uniref:Uncharacterized protein n=1 Tax=Xenorhabdus szentirmaii DSM 16338 TaxID=1427518 RepID=W1IU83_9GAMM|nr:hypothetical protein XSR1_110062 [Xenorhabdus szentirmaii DSM 16338]
MSDNGYKAEGFVFNLPFEYEIIVNVSVITFFLFIIRHSP